MEPTGIDALARDFFIHALIDMGACYMLYDEKGHCICITSLPARWAGKLDAPPTDEGIFGAQIAQQLTFLRQSLKQAGDQSAIEVNPDSESTFEFRCRKVDIPRQGIYFILSVVNRSEERQREKVLRTLLLEVSHRSKNLLAVVQGIATQTARFSGSLEGFLQKFRGRLYALSQSQDLVTDSSWRGATFRDLIDKQLSRYVTENPGVVTVSGDNLLLSPNAAMHVGLALHELIVNAVSHGDLLRGDRAIRVNCERVGDAKEDIRISWTESAPRNVDESPNEHDGRFGSTVLDRVVPASVNGKAIHRIDTNGVYYELTFPLEAHD